MFSFNEPPRETEQLVIAPSLGAFSETFSAAAGPTAALLVDLTRHHEPGSKREAVASLYKKVPVSPLVLQKQMLSVLMSVAFRQAVRSLHWAGTPSVQTWPPIQLEEHVSLRTIYLVASMKKHHFNVPN